MAIFGTKKNTKKADSAVKADAPAKVTKTKAVKAAKVTVPAVISSAPVVSSVTDVIIRPRITEKSGLLSQSGVYTFEVRKSANKNSIAQAIKALYKVTPVKIAVINTPNKEVFVRGHHGVVSGVRKALITLKKGDKIDFV